MKWIIGVAVAILSTVGAAKAQGVNQEQTERLIVECVRKMDVANMVLAKQRVYSQCLKAKSDMLSNKQAFEWVGIVDYVYANNIHATLNVLIAEHSYILISSYLSNSHARQYRYFSERLIELNIKKGDRVRFSGTFPALIWDFSTLPNPIPRHFEDPISIFKLEVVK